ncbi:hypothetical protein SAMN05216353_13424 [Halobacillus alkaliphilus]|uniref:Uncharacterized protein n=1 Tax=Halobacillus alkaliphilus TaxID=396056 RepID=A0A1I2QTZ6_9BACI|nr:hypothetical protein [Halobacillus alkaliphilus]SFG31892.1 hypothetical protein SAMN05216353_13424 [Halobacillus alkaliphilus]
MNLFFFITVIVGLTFIFLYFVLRFDLKKKQLEVEEKRLDLEKRTFELSEDDQKQEERL